MVKSTIAGNQVDDRKPPDDEPYVSLEVKSVAVRATMTNHLVHARENFRVDGPLAIVIDQTRNSAHSQASP